MAATTPFTIAGCVVEINANVLAAIALAQMKHPGALRGHREVGFTGRGVDGLVYTNPQPYSKRACAFGLRSLSKLLTLSALVKPEKSLFFLERIATKKHKRDKKTAKNYQNFGHPAGLSRDSCSEFTVRPAYRVCRIPETLGRLRSYMLAPHLSTRTNPPESQ